MNNEEQIEWNVDTSDKTLDTIKKSTTRWMF